MVVGKVRKKTEQLLVSLKLVLSLVMIRINAREVEGRHVRMLTTLRSKKMSYLALGNRPSSIIGDLERILVASRTT